jgi:hypothetical protein
MCSTKQPGNAIPYQEVFTCNGWKNRSGSLFPRGGKVELQVKLGGANGWSLLVGRLNCHTRCSQLDATPKTSFLTRAWLYYISDLRTVKCFMCFTVITPCSSAGVDGRFGGILPPASSCVKHYVYEHGQVGKTL